MGFLTNMTGSAEHALHKGGFAARHFRFFSPEATDRFIRQLSGQPKRAKLHFVNFLELFTKHCAHLITFNAFSVAGITNFMRCFNVTYMNLRRIFKILTIALLSLVLLAVVLLGAISAYVYVNEDKIYQMLIDELNEGQLGYTEVERVDVSPFANFPYISVGLHGVRFYGDKLKSDEPIYAFEDVYVGFDVWDILRSEYTVKKLKLSEGYIRLVLDEHGESNLSVAKGDGKTDEEEVGSSGVHLDLRAVSVQNVRLEEINQQGKKYIDLMMNDVYSEFSSVQDFVRITLKGDFVLQEYTADAVTFFKDKPLSLDTRFTYDVVGGMFIILPGKLLLEYGSLDFSGSIDFENDLLLDIELSGKKKNFDVFISFAPNEVAEKLNRFRNEGDIYFKGRIFGRSLNADPAIDITMGCENTFFFHKNEGKAIKDFSFNGRFHTGANNSLETAELVLSNLYGIPESGEFRGTVRVVNFLNPMMSLDFHADVDLANFQSFYDPDWLIEAGGALRVDITINEFVDQDSVIHVASKLEDGTLSRIEFKNAWMQLADYHHRLENLEGKVVLDGDNILLEKLYAKVGESDMLLTARLGQLNSLLHKQPSEVDLKLHIESERLDMASLLPKDMRDTNVVWHTEVVHGLQADFDLITSVNGVYNYKYLPDFELNFRKFNARLEGFELPLERLSGKIRVSDNLIDVEDLTLVLGENDLHLYARVDDPSLFFDKSKKGETHFRTAILSDNFDFKKLLYYRGKPLLDPDIQAELGDEHIRKLDFVCDGYLQPSSISANGLKGYCNIERFTVRINELPKLRNARGRIRADTTGCLHIEDFYASLGRSDYRANLKLLHLLDTIGDKREIHGTIGGKLWDLDEYFALAKKEQSTKPVEAALSDSLSQAMVHKPQLNIFALPFPVMDLRLDVGSLINEKYKLSHVHGHFRASPDHMVWIDSLHFDAAGGHISIEGYLNGSNKDDLYLSGRIVLDDVDIDQVFFKMDNFGQDYMVSEQVHGRLDGVIEAKAYLYPDLSPKLDRTEAQLNVRIKDGRLENFAPMQAMSDFMGSRNLNNIRFAEMENTLTYNQGKLVVPRMRIASTLGYIHLSGKQDLNENIDYEIQVPLSLVKSAGWSMMRNKLGGGKRRADQKELAEIEEDIISEQRGLVRKYMTFQVSGTVDNFDVGLGKNKNLE